MINTKTIKLQIGTILKSNTGYPPNQKVAKVSEKSCWLENVNGVLGRNSWNTINEMLTSGRWTAIKPNDENN